MEHQSGQAFVELVAIGMILAFVLGISIVIFVLIYQRRLANQKLDVERLKVEHQKTLIHSSMKVVENERSTFASNLHDEIGAQIAIAKISISSLNHVDLEDQREETIERFSTIMDDISDSIRRISYNLQPPVLIKMGLASVIKDYIGKIPSDTLAVKFNDNLHSKRFSKEVELHTYRIIQEVFSNAIKHAKCSEIEVELNEVGGLFSLKITDNGIGFNQDLTAGMGLANIKLRAEMIAFNLTVESSNKGTTIFMSPKNELE